MPLKAPEENQKDTKEVTTSLAVTKEIGSCSSGCFVRTGWHFHIIGRTKDYTKDFPQCKRCFCFTLNWLWEEIS